ncbi:tRNA 2-thiouridine synthesizing protein A [Sphingobium sp. OAS761]|nr:tRNA 2-thiouridine synthesizing protein A [Sphingobium sp. OAS761]
MKCPWPALRAARAMRNHPAVLVEADDPVAPRELEALAGLNGWQFESPGGGRFILRRKE